MLAQSVEGQLMRFPKGFFVTGTDTDVGKTVVCAILMMGLDAVYWKPVQSGNQEDTDTRCIRRITGMPAKRFAAEVYTLTQPLSPHAAAAIDGVRIDLANFSPPRTQPDQHLIVEGAGGLLVPLNERDMVIDLIAHLELPVLLVARSGLGTLNHTLLSIAQLRQRSLPVLGVVMNGPSNRANWEAIERYGEVPVLAQIEPLPTLKPEVLHSCYQRSFEVDDG